MSLLKFDNNQTNYLIAVEEIKDNTDQWRVYETQGSCVILAGPGSGKTKTITIKAAKLLNEEVRYPRGIACITYNNECARELRRRLDRLGVAENSNLFIGTVHSFCLKNVILPYGKIAGLKLPDPLSIASQREQRQIFQKVVEKELGDPEAQWSIRVNKYRRTYLDRDTSSWKTENRVLARLVESYEEELRKNGYIDFDDMVLWGLYLIENNNWIRKLIKARFPVLVVDEYQDLGLPLHRIVLSLFFQAGVRLIAVGDPDQSIYGFTGAKPGLLKELSEIEGIELIRLRLNYRCGKKIVHASQVTIGEDRDYEVPFEANEGTIDFYECNQGLNHQAEMICQNIVPDILNRIRCNIGDIAILYPNRFIGDYVASKAEDIGYNFIRIDQNAPYRKTPLIHMLEDCALWCSEGWHSGEPKLSLIIKTWLRFFNRNDYDNNEMINIKRQLVKFLWLNREPNMSLHNWLDNFESMCLHYLKQQETMFDEMEAFQYLKKASDKGYRLEKFTVEIFARQGGAPGFLNLLTLHSSKGSEFDAVILMGIDQRNIPGSNPGETERIEKRRLFYVGLTRARYEVHITYSVKPSEFLVELEKNL